MAKKRNFRPTINRCLLVGVSALLLNGCRLVVSNDGAGYILSESGNLSCHQASCTFPIETLLTDRLLAIPQDGYRFVQWLGRRRTHLLKRLGLHPAGD